jgi:hypothetical protein
MTSLPAHANAPAAATTRPRTATVLLALGLVSAVALLTVGGTILAIDALKGRSAEPTRAFPAPADANLKQSYAVGEDVPTSFGAMAVQHAERIDGLTSRDLAGMTHGVNGLVREKLMRLQASVTVTNLLDRPLRYTPESFTLRTSKDGAPLKLSGANVKPGILEPDASIDLRIDYTAPKSAKRFWLDFADPGRAQPQAVRLGAVKAVPTRKSSPTAQDALVASAGAGAAANHDGHGE